MCVLLEISDEVTANLCFIIGAVAAAVFVAVETEDIHLLLLLLL